MGKRYKNYPFAEAGKISLFQKIIVDLQSQHSPLILLDNKIDLVHSKLEINIVFFLVNCIGHRRGGCCLFRGWITSSCNFSTASHYQKFSSV